MEIIYKDNKMYVDIKGVEYELHTNIYTHEITDILNKYGTETILECMKEEDIESFLRKKKLQKIIKK